MKIAQNKKINDQLMEIRKSRLQEYMSDSNMIITDCNKNKYDTVIHRNINNEEIQGVPKVLGTFEVPISP